MILLVAPVLGLLADVGLVAELGHALGLGEEFLGLVLTLQAPQRSLPQKN